MKRSWTALAVTLFALAVLAGCNDYNNSVQYDTGATLTNLSPSGMPAGPPPSSGTITQCPGTPSGQNNPCFTLFVIASGSNPFQGTGTLPVVRWNGQNLTTTYIDTTNVSAQVPYSYIKNPGTVAINTYQPTGQGTGYNGLSNALTFTIYGNPNPYPTLSSVTPTTAAYCDSTTTSCASIPITVTGTHFIPVSQNGGSSVTLTGASTYNQETAITVNSITSTQMKATIPGKLLCASGPVQVNVLNPPSAICLLNCPNLGGGDTNDPPSGLPVTTQMFTITNPTAVNSCPANIPPTTTAAETPAISQDGRYVVYASPQNGISQVLLHDTCLGAAKDCVAATRTVSVTADGTVGNGDSHNVALTPDGRYVAFSSAAGNLVENAPAGRQVYLRDTCNGTTGSCKPTTQLVSTDEAGKLLGMAAVLPSVSASGRFVAFVAETPSVVAAANVASTPNSTVRQIFVRDTCLGTTNCTPKATRISALTSDVAAGSSNAAGPGLVAEDVPAISRDGRYVAYTSAQNGSWQIVLSDTCLGAGNGCTPSTRTISTAADSSAGNGASHNAVMTPDGRYVAFSSAATNLIENAPLGRQVYLRDTCAEASGSCKPNMMLVSTDEEGKLFGTEGILPSLSSSGRYVAFLAVTASQAAGATLSPNSGLRQVFVRDTCLGTAKCAPQSTRISLQPGYVPMESEKPAGPALASLTNQIAIADGKNATMFTPIVAADERVLVAIPSENK
jgi:Tol biopolymer transport system component